MKLERSEYVSKGPNMTRSKKEVAQIMKEARHLRSLLKAFDLKLGGWNPGVLAYAKAGHKNHEGKEVLYSLNFDRREWAFLEPLLIELKKRRRDDIHGEGT